MSRLAKKLKAAKDGDMLKCIWDCGHAKDKDAVEPLIDILLHDKSSKLRSEAALVLGHIGDKRALDPLLEVLKLGSSSEQAGKNLSSTLDILERMRRGEWVLGELFASGDLGDLVQIRRAASCALGELADSKAVDPLINALKDWSWMVQCEAAVALGKIRDEKAVKHLKRLLAESGDENVRGAALKALEYFSD